MRDAHPQVALLVFGHAAAAIDVAIAHAVFISPVGIFGECFRGRVIAECGGFVPCVVEHPQVALAVESHDFQEFGFLGHQRIVEFVPSAVGLEFQ